MYNEHAAEYDIAIRDNIYNAKFERPSLLRLLPALSGKRVLDLACGPGVYALELVARGALVTAIDNSEQMVALTQSKIESPHNSYIQDISLGFPEEESRSFDVVICPLAIHYLPSLTTLFNDIARVLKPDGVFVFSTHHPHIDYRDSATGDYFATEKVTEQWQTLGRPVPVTFYRRPISTLAAEIANSGMVITNISEGIATEQLKNASPEHFKLLSSKPNFMFYVCKPDLAVQKQCAPGDR